MHIGIATDIYGIGGDIPQLASGLRSRGAAVTIISALTELESLQKSSAHLKYSAVRQSAGRHW